MLDKLIKENIPMTETAYYILISLSRPRHGYGIIKFVDELTEGRIKLGSGTVYGTLTKMKRKEIILSFSDEEQKTVYFLTDVGKQLLQTEMARIKKLHQNTLEQENLFK
jgi:DNA-binding PadR family transcriptional regulator